MASFLVVMDLIVFRVSSAGGNVPVAISLVALTSAIALTLVPLVGIASQVNTRIVGLTWASRVRA